MSRTYARKPIWLQTVQKGVIDHDHTSGKCIVPSVQEDRYKWWGGNRHNCRKHLGVEVLECFHDARHPGVHVLRGETLPNKSGACRNADVRMKNLEMPKFSHEVRRAIWDRSIPCICDQEEPTCVRSDPRGVVRRADQNVIKYGALPSKKNRRIKNKRVRASQRHAMNDWADEYNSGLDVDDQVAPDPSPLY